MKGYNGFKGLGFEVNVFSYNKIAFLGKEDGTSYKGMALARLGGDTAGPLLTSWRLSYGSFNHCIGNFLEKN